MSYSPDHSRTAPRGSSVNSWLVIALVVVLAVLALRMWDFGGGRSLLDSGPLTDPSVQPREQTPAGDLAGDENANIALFKQSKPSVVNITTTAVRRDRFTFNPIEIPQGTGTGFIWEVKQNTAYVVTNYHVIREANRSRVTLADSTEGDAELVGADPDNDLAVLKIAAKSALVPLPLGTSGDLQVGQKVLAIGNPFGLDHTLTTGVISGLGREIEAATGRTIRDVIQTDAAINPGNSGGPLLNSRGNLIGVNTAIYSPSGASAGIGFAIPVDTVNRVVTQIIQGNVKRVVRPALGVRIANSPNDRIRGVIVVSVVEGSPAALAGIRGHDRARLEGELGDIILAVDGVKLRTPSALQQAVEKHEAGDKVKLTILRGDEELEVEVELRQLTP